MPKPDLAAIAAGFLAAAKQEKSPEGLLYVRRDHFTALCELAKPLPTSETLAEALDEAAEVSLAASMVEVPAFVLEGICEPVIASLEAKAKPQVAAPKPTPAPEAAAKPEAKQPA